MGLIIDLKSSVLFMEYAGEYHAHCSSRQLTSAPNKHRVHEIAYSFGHFGGPSEKQLCLREDIGHDLYLLPPGVFKTLNILERAENHDIPEHPMVKSCCVVGCRADTRKLQRLVWHPWMKGLTFHHFPKEPFLRKKWIDLVKRDDSFVPTKDTWICSRHFVGGKGPTEEHPYPTGFPYNNYKWPVQPRQSSHNIAKKRFHNSLNRSTDSDHCYLSALETICPPPSSKKVKQEEVLSDEIFKDNDIRVGSSIEISQSGVKTWMAHTRQHSESGFHILVN